MNLVVVDTETSDLEPSKGATILEIAWVVVTCGLERWEPISSYETYIQYNGPINPHAQASHHIRADSLTAEKGAISRDDAIACLRKYLSEDTIVVAHNSDFDSKFLPEITHPWLCTYRASKHIWPNAPGHSNQVLRYWLGIDPKLEGRHPHQALFDAMTTAHILIKMLEQYQPLDLLALSKSGINLKTIPFGKHKGTDFSQIPRDYLTWLRNQSNLDLDLKHTIDSILNGP